jgi:hypothetical protein
MMKRQTWARVLIAAAFFISGSLETVSATGLVVELSRDGRWGPGIHTLAVSGPLQMLGAVLIVSGRKPNWVMSILGGYLLLAGVFGNLPLIFNPNVSRNAVAGLIGDVAVLGGIAYWLQGERIPDAPRSEPALSMTNRERGYDALGRTSS